MLSDKQLKIVLKIDKIFIKLKKLNEIAKKEKKILYISCDTVSALLLPC